LYQSARSKQRKVLTGVYLDCGCPPVSAELKLETFGKDALIKPAGRTKTLWRFAAA